MYCIAGEFHFQMHVTHALYRLGGASYLLPVAQSIGFKYLTIDFALKNWDKHDEFLLLFCDAGMLWLQGR